MSYYNYLVDDKLDQIIYKSLSLDPAQRYPNAIEMANDLKEWKKNDKKSKKPDKNSIITRENHKISKMVKRALEIAAKPEIYEDTTTIIDIEGDDTLGTKSNQSKKWKSSFLMSNPLYSEQTSGNIFGKEFFLREITTNLYLKNGFRILNLQTNASSECIDQSFQKIMAMSRLRGIKEALGVITLPLSQNPEIDDLLRAKSRLDSSKLRLIDEIFWFWHDPSPNILFNKAFELLKLNDYPASISIWRMLEVEEKDNVISVHNLAVLYHVLVLDLEYASINKELDEFQSKKRENYWKQAFIRWNKILDDEAFWNIIYNRIKTLDDPTLKTSFINNLSQILPHALISINAKLAIKSARSGNINGLNRHLKIIHQSGFSNHIIKNVLETEAKPIFEEITLICNKAKKECQETPSNCHKILDSVLKRSECLLISLKLILNEDNPILLDSKNQVFESLFECITNEKCYSNEEEIKMTLNILTEAQKLATTESRKERVSKIIKIMNNSSLNELNRIFDSIIKN